MSDENLKQDAEAADEVVEVNKKASKKKEAVNEPVAQEAPVSEEVPVVEETPIVEEAVVGSEPLGFSPASYTFSAYNMWNPWITAQNGDLISYNTNVNTKDWAGAVVFQNGQYNTTQRGF